MRSSRRDLGAAVLAAVAVSALSGVAHAGADTLVRLEYQADGPRGCVGEDELRHMVTGQLGHDPFRVDADRRVAITITKAETGFQGRIIWTEADGRHVGERLLSSRSRDCREIAANVAFAVALQLQLIDHGAPAPTDPGANVSNGAPPAPPAPKVTDRTNPPAASPQRPTLSAEAAAVPVQPPALQRLALAVGAGPAVGVGIAPEATALGRVFVGARFRRLSAEIAADAALPATQRASDDSSVVVNAIGSSAAGCGHLSMFAACVLGRIGWIRARGTGVDAPHTAWARFNEVGMRLAATKDFGRVIVSVHADGLVMLSRWKVVLNDAVIWSVPRVGGIVGLDVAVRFY